VLETVGREWLVERALGTRTMSNKYSIGRGAERLSAGLHALIRDSGWSDEDVPSYAEAIGNPDREHIGNAGMRQASSAALLRTRAGELDAADLMRVLRDHGSGDRFHPEWREECTTTRTLCMHAGTEDRPGQAVGAMVSELFPGRGVHWVTATAAPCISIFKPVLLNAPLPWHGPSPDDRFDARTLWWRHELLHRRAIAGNYGRFLDEIRPERDALEARFQRRIRAVMHGASAAERAQAVEWCWKEASRTEERWLARLGPPSSSRDTPFDAAWNEMNRKADMNIAQPGGRGG
jgi:secernin